MQQLPSVFLKLRIAPNEDFGCSFVYGTTLTVPGEFFRDTADTNHITNRHLRQLREHVRLLAQVSTSQYVWR